MLTETPAKGLSLKGRALRYLAAREHSRQELTRKLLPHAASLEDLEALLDTLEAAGLLSAARFVESIIRRKSGRFGASRIKHELQQHGVDTELITQAVSNLDLTELERAQAIWQKRYGPEASPQAQSSAERQKQDRFLRQRGFSSDVIRQVLRDAHKG